MKIHGYATLRGAWRVSSASFVLISFLFVFGREWNVMLSRLVRREGTFQKTLKEEKETSWCVLAVPRLLPIILLPSQFLVCLQLPWIWQPAFAITLACYCCRRLWKMATGLAYTLHKFRHKLEIVVTFMAWKPIVMRIAPPELCCCCRYITQQLHTNEAQLRCWCHTIFCELKSSAAIRRRNGGDC